MNILSAIIMSVAYVYLLIIAAGLIYVIASCYCWIMNKVFSLITGEKFELFDD